MRRVTIYTTPICPYCVRAKASAQEEGRGDPTRSMCSWTGDAREEMEQRSGGRRTVPQIFIGETHVGGSDDLHALEHAGELDPLLSK